MRLSILYLASLSLAFHGTGAARLRRAQASAAAGDLKRAAAEVVWRSDLPRQKIGRKGVLSTDGGRLFLPMSPSDKQGTQQFVTCTNTADGKQAWNVSVGASRVDQLAYSSNGTGDVVVVSSRDIQQWDLYMVALAPKDGKVLWKTYVGRGEGAQSSLHVVTAGNGKAFASVDRNVIAMDLATGEKLWEASLANFFSTAPVVDNNATRVFAMDNSVTLYALDASNGQLLWKKREDAFSTATPPLLSKSNELVYTTGVTADGHVSEIVAFQTSDGSVAWRNKLEGKDRVEDGTSLSESAELAMLFMMTSSWGDDRTGPMIKGMHTGSGDLTRKVSIRERSGSSPTVWKHVESLLPDMDRARIYIPFQTDGEGAIGVFDLSDKNVTGQEQTLMTGLKTTLSDQEGVIFFILPLIAISPDGGHMFAAVNSYIYTPGVPRNDAALSAALYKVTLPAPNTTAS